MTASETPIPPGTGMIPCSSDVATTTAVHEIRLR